MTSRKTNTEGDEAMYWLYRIDDDTFDVVTKPQPGLHGPYRTELAAHFGALDFLLRDRECINRAIAVTRKRIKHCK